MDLPRCQRQLLISPLVFVGMLILLTKLKYPWAAASKSYEVEMEGTHARMGKHVKDPPASYHCTAFTHRGFSFQESLSFESMQKKSEQSTALAAKWQWMRSVMV